MSQFNITTRHEIDEDRLDEWLNANVPDQNLVRVEKVGSEKK